MTAIVEQKWGEVIVYTWGDLLSHQWMNFRIALMDTEAEQTVQGVVVETSGAVNDSITDMQAQGVKVVYSPVVMRTRTEMIVSIVVSERDYKSAMLEYLPLYERNSGVINEVITAYDREFRNGEQRLDVVKHNAFVDTAIESLPIYERDLGIEPNRTLRYDQRREQISSRFRAAFDQTTEETIRDVANAYSNGEVEVNKTDDAGVYEIKFIGTRGIPDNLEGLKAAIDVVVPAHLAFIYTFTFNTWGMISHKTWGDVSTMTWDDLRTWDEVS